MIDRLAELNAQLRRRAAGRRLSIRIGLNSGPMVFGNIGSTGHLSLTVMGDNVNLGARLEGINKLYGTAIIASEATVELARDVIVARELDLVRVKGKAQTPSASSRSSAPPRTASRWAELIEHFQAGLAAYRARDWETAIAAFERALALRPDDGPSRSLPAPLPRAPAHAATPGVGAGHDLRRSVTRLRCAPSRRDARRRRRALRLRGASRALRR